MSSEHHQHDLRLRMDALIARTARELLEAGDGRDAVAEVARRFLDTGMKIVGSPMALWEHFAEVLDRAGYDATARDRRRRIYSTVSHERFSPGRPLPDD